MNMLTKDWGRNLIFLIVYIISGLSLVVIMDSLMTGAALDPINILVEKLTLPVRTPTLTLFMLVVTNVGSPFVLSFLTLLIAILIVIHKDTYDTLLFLAAISLSSISCSILKSMISLPRPTYGIVELASWSFPSAHATIATAFFFSLAYAYFDKFKKAWVRACLVIFSISSVILICLSRIYLGVHYTVDVIGGIALGLMTVSFIILVFNIFLAERKDLPRKRMRSESRVIR